MENITDYMRYISKQEMLIKLGHGRSVFRRGVMNGTYEYRLTRGGRLERRLVGGGSWETSNERFNEMGDDWYAETFNVHAEVIKNSGKWTLAYVADKESEHKKVTLLPNSFTAVCAPIESNSPPSLEYPDVKDFNIHLIGSCVLLEDLK